MFNKIIDFVVKHSQWMLNERGGGDSGGVQQAPTTPAPDPSETAKQQYEARLKYDPLMARQQMQIQQEMMPEQAQLYQSLFDRYYPQLARRQQAMQQELYPYQSQIVEQGAQKALERLQDPSYMTPEEQAAQQAERARATENLQQAMRTQANLGGGLYGGRTQAKEAETVANLQNQFAIQDYQNRMQNAYQAQQALNPYMSILYPQVGAQAQPGYQPYQYQSAVPDANTLYNALYQASQPQYYAQQGSASPAWGLGGSALGAAGLMGAAAISSNRYKKDIKIWE